MITICESSFDAVQILPGQAVKPGVKYKLILERPKVGRIIEDINYKVLRLSKVFRLRRFDFKKCRNIDLVPNI